MPRLTKRFLDTLKPDPTSSDRTFWDDMLSGFGVRVRGSGAMTWIIMYRTQEGRLRKYRLGQVGLLHLTKRVRIRQKLASVDKGGDPAGERGLLRQQSQCLSFATSTWLTRKVACPPPTRQTKVGSPAT